jgi:glucosyl-3-phosphoglycerate synthase
MYRTGCRGFNGPFPLPLWMSGMKLSRPMAVPSNVAHTVADAQRASRRETAVLPEVEHWRETNMSLAEDWPLDRLLAAKGDQRISVVLPALDEEPTVGAIVQTIRTELMNPSAPLVDELVVMDSGSTDRTADIARAAGATVVARDSVLPGIASVPGKGEVLWRSLMATSGDIVVFIDADLREVSAWWVLGLIGPLLCDPSLSLVKATYQRPFDDGDVRTTTGGGRVTELVARPLLNLHWPLLAGIEQPLSGEYAARRTVLERLRFRCGYGVEIAILIDTLNIVGLDGIAQVDLGIRRHDHQDLNRLGRMAAEIWLTALDRLEEQGHTLVVEAPLPIITQFTLDEPQTHVVPDEERPPILTVPEYADDPSGIRRR